jgi:hypothetical protein
VIIFARKNKIIRCYTSKAEQRSKRVDTEKEDSEVLVHKSLYAVQPRIAHCLTLLPYSGSMWGLPGIEPVMMLGLETQTKPLIWALHDITQARGRV